MLRRNAHLPLLGILVLCLLPCWCSVAALRVADVVKIQGYIESLINSTAVVNADNLTKYPLIPAFVRLNFHDCNSPNGCDGCVNLNIEDNKGLQTPVNALESLYNNATLGLKGQMTRADFWVLAGLVAANFGARLSKQGSNAPMPATLIPTTTFKTGRTDCPTAPNGAETNSSFPNALQGLNETLAFFKNSYNFTTNETVTIMGAHTLGKARRINSGFSGPWVPGDNILNNRYYTEMLINGTPGPNAVWAQVSVPVSGKTQWQRASGPQSNLLMMLNSDMCLAKALKLNATGGSICTYTTCQSSVTLQTVQAYAADNAK
eukprot:gene1997-2319_t